MKKNLVGLGALLLFTHTSCWAGVRLTFKENHTGFGSERLCKTDVQIEGMNARFETKCDPVRSNTGEILIFRGDKNVLWTIETLQKTYTEMTLDDFKAQQEKIKKDQEERAQKRLNDLPAEYRNKSAATWAQNTYVFKPTDQTRLVGRWKCSVYQDYRNNRLQDEICTADPAIVLPGLEDLMQTYETAETWQLMGDFPLKLAAQKKAMGDATFPVRSELRAFGKVIQSNELYEARLEKFPDTAFDLPVGLTREELPQPQP